MVETILVYWAGFGLLSMFLSTFLVVLPSRRITEAYFLQEFDLEKEFLYMYSLPGAFMHYLIHGIIAIVSGPIIGFATTYSRQDAIKGYTKSLIRSGLEEIGEDDVD